MPKQKTAIVLLLLGFTSGILSGLLGIGGGALMVPGLVFFLAFPQHRAHGTSLLAMVMLGTVGVVTYAIHGFIDVALALEIAVGGVIGAVFGAKAAKELRGKTLRLIFAAFLVFVGLRMIWGAFYASSQPLAFALEQGGWQEIVVVLATGLITGFVSALLGIGGGMVMVPAMAVLLGVQQQIAQGVSLAAMIPTALTGVLLHNRMGNVDFRVGKWLGFGGILGALGGALTAANLESATLKMVFGTFVLIMAILMALKKQRQQPAE